MERVNMLRLGGSEVAVFWLGQNSYVLKTHEGTKFAIDPYLSRDKRYSYVYPEPPVKPEELEVHFIFCTHDHLDHTDPQALPIIARRFPGTKFLGPRESCEHLAQLGIRRNRVEVLDAGVPRSFRDLKVTAYYSVPPDEGDTTHFGYLFEVEGIKIYNMGDTYQSVVRNPRTILSPIMEASPDIAILPIVGDTPERRPEDAFLFAKLIKPKIAIPSHYDCFSNRTIDPERFVQLFKDEPDIKPVIIPYKGMYIYRG
ncbi:MAG: MBL fold metallo-hydrolase [Candidatus Bathyarchaeia archaeon]